MNYNYAECRAKPEGVELDGASRAIGNGFEVFALRPESAERTTLATAINYCQGGPLE